MTKTANTDKFQELENTALQVELRNVKAERDELTKQLAIMKEHRDKLQNIINQIQVSMNQ